MLLEAAQIAQEYHRDFGSTLKPPAGITTFRYKTTAGHKAKKPAAKPVAAKASAPADPKIADLQKRKAQIQKKLEAAKTAGKPTRNLDDRLYEIEDELRLAGNAS